MLTPFQIILKTNDSKLVENSANKLLEYLKLLMEQQMFKVIFNLKR